MITNMESYKRIFLVIAILISGAVLPASTIQNVDMGDQAMLIRDKLKKAADLEFEQKYSDAAKCYREMAEKQHSPKDAAAYYLREADALMKGNLTRRAYEVYSLLLNSYLFHIPLEGVIENLRILAHNYDIGQGTLWGISDPTASIEIYRMIVKYQPAIEFSLNDRLILAEKLIKETEFVEAVKVLQELVKLAPQNPDARLALARLLMRLAQESDGDGVRGRNAIREAKSFLRYATSSDPRRQEAEAIIKDSQNLEASRIFLMAQFYLNKYHYRPAVARRYLHDIIHDFPNTTSAPAAKALLDAGIPDEPVSK